MRGGTCASSKKFRGRTEKVFSASSRPNESHFIAGFWLSGARTAPTFTISEASKKVWPSAKFCSDLWKQFSPREISFFSRPGECFYYEKDAISGSPTLANATRAPPAARHTVRSTKPFSKWTPDVMFAPGAVVTNLGRHPVPPTSPDPQHGPATMRTSNRLESRIVRARLRRLFVPGKAGLPLPEAQLRQKPAQRPFGRNSRRPTVKWMVTATAFGCELRTTKAEDSRKPFWITAGVQNQDFVAPQPGQYWAGQGSRTVRQPKLGPPQVTTPCR